MLGPNIAHIVFKLFYNIRVKSLLAQAAPKNTMSLSIKGLKRDYSRLNPMK